MEQVKADSERQTWLNVGAIPEAHATNLELEGWQRDSRMCAFQ